MAQPIFITPPGSLGTIPEGIFFQVPVLGYDPDDPDNPDAVYYTMLAGELPPGVQCRRTGLIEGIPKAIASLQGVPQEVSNTVVFTFSVRAYTEKLVNGIEVIDRVRDQTFSLTVTGQDVPDFVTPGGQIATVYDGSAFEYQIEYTDTDPNDTVEVALFSGQLPPGLSVTTDGLITGYIEPVAELGTGAIAGYDTTPKAFYPYDFTTRGINKNYQFTLSITDGKDYNLRTFEIYVYAKNTLTGDTTDASGDNSFITADVVTTRTPILLTPESDLGRIRHDNWFAFKFDGYDADGDAIEYIITLGEGIGFDSALVSGEPGSFDATGEGFDRGGFQLPPGLSLDANTGWLYGYIPDQSTTEVDYRFAIRVRKKDDPTVISGFYYFTMTIIGDIESEVIWITDSDLGIIQNGAISTLVIEAENVGGLPLTYRLRSGSYPDTGGYYNKLPQGLRLLPSGEIAGRASFNTFALDGGTTTFDKDVRTRLVADETTFDLEYTFTVNAYNDTDVQVFKSLDSITITDGGSDYITDPLITFSPSPVGAGATVAQTGTVTIKDGVVTGITMVNTGSGYTQDLTGVTFVGGGLSVSGEAATAVPVVNGSGQVTAITITSGGFGYTSAPDVIITGPGANATATASIEDGVIVDIAVGNPGAGYIGNINITISAFSANRTAVGTSGTSFLTMGEIDRRGLVAGLAAIGNGIPTGTTITSVIGDNINLTANLTANVSGIVNFSDLSGSGATATSVMVDTETLGGISVFKTFTLTVDRNYTEPYESLYIKAMPPFDDRTLISDILEDANVFPASDIYRSDDANFGMATDLVYQHAFGLTSSALVDYVEAMQLNHYLKQATVGEIKTAQALDADGNVLYEVVYSEITDDLVNNQGQSVSRSVDLPFAVDVDGVSETTVYPNSFDNMRDQVIDTVGQITPGLPAWMTSKQTDGRVLGFVRAWVLAYVNPGTSGRVAYNLRNTYGSRLNTIDFMIDRYELDRRYSRFWEPTVDVPGDTVDQTTVDVSSTEILVDTVPETGGWIPSEGQTTFDSNTTIFDSGSMRFVRPVDTYGSGDEYDKYLVFPKRTILG